MNTKLVKFLAIVALSIGFPMLTGCEDKEEINETPEFVIDQKYLNHSVEKSGKVIEIPVQTTISSSKWMVDFENCKDWILVMPKGPANGEGSLSITVRANNSDVDRTGIVTVSSLTKDYKITIRQWGSSDLQVEGDFQVKVTGAKATNYQPGGEIALSYDDDVNTIFHSDWNKANTWPFELTYNFKGDEEINYVEYVPRPGGGNGSIGTFELFYADDSQRKNWTKVGDFDFKQSSQPSRANLPDGVMPTSVKFSITSGVGGFVSCAEMRFMRRNTNSSLDGQLLDVFTDLTCSELKPGVTDEQIQALDPTFARVAEALRDNSYDELEKSFRIHEYNAYSNPTDWNGPLMTKVYSNWDNPMGIAVKKGEKVIILVGDTHGNNLSVQIVGEYKDKDGWRPQGQGSFHSLSAGVNQIEPDQDGQLFLMYNTAVPGDSKPVKVHVPLGQGTLAGYWSLAEHKTDEKFAEIIAKTSHKYFCVVGERMILYFKRTLFKRKIVDAITQWDNIITWQQNFMGIEDVRPRYWNNHIAGISLDAGTGGYMWASDWVMGFVDYKIESEDIMGLNNFNRHADNAWGPAHEMGHVNQMAINWASTTESSNNLFSNYVLNQFGRYSSRGSGLAYRFDAVYARNHSWASMCNDLSDGPSVPRTSTGEYFGEDTGIHMRMNWQLWNYYHRVCGDEKFFGRVFKLMRELGLNETSNPGRKQIEFAVACSEAAGEDLTDFFEAWGFFKAHTSKISQYGTYDYNVTAAMINDAKARMSKLPKPKHALEYIEDRDAASGPKPGDFAWDKVGNMGYYTAYEKNLKVSSSASANVAGRTVAVSNCKEAVAIEIRVKKGSEYGEIRYASNFNEFTVPEKVNIAGCAVYAVQADGTRIFLANM